MFNFSEVHSPLLRRFRALIGFWVPAHKADCAKRHRLARRRLHHLVEIIVLLPIVDIGGGFAEACLVSCLQAAVDVYVDPAPPSLPRLSFPDLPPLPLLVERRLLVLDCQEFPDGTSSVTISVGAPLACLFSYTLHMTCSSL